MSFKRCADKMIDPEDYNGESGETSAGPNTAPRTEEPLELTNPLPILIVLDLDKTMWPVYCQEETAGPYRRYCDGDNAVICEDAYRRGRKIVRLFPDVVNILHCLKQKKVKLAVASRSPVDEGGAARGILGALGLLEMFCCLEIHSGSKAVHFKDIHAATGIAYQDMLFFDDENYNIKNVSKLGVTCVKLSKESGLTIAALNLGLKQYRELCLSRTNLRKWFTPVSQHGKKTG